MKIRRIDPNAEASTETNKKLVSLCEADLQNVSGAAGCDFALATGGAVVILNHPTYEEKDGSSLS